MLDPSAFPYIVTLLLQHPLSFQVFMYVLWSSPCSFYSKSSTLALLIALLIMMALLGLSWVRKRLGRVSVSSDGDRVLKQTPDTKTLGAHPHILFIEGVWCLPFPLSYMYLGLCTGWWCHLGCCKSSTSWLAPPGRFQSCHHCEADTDHQAGHGPSGSSWSEGHHHRHTACYITTCTQAFDIIWPCWVPFRTTWPFL